MRAGTCPDRAQRCATISGIASEEAWKNEISGCASFFVHFEDLGSFRNGPGGKWIQDRIYRCDRRFELALWIRWMRTFWFPWADRSGPMKMTFIRCLKPVLSRSTAACRGSADAGNLPGRATDSPCAGRPSIPGRTQGNRMVAAGSDPAGRNSALRHLGRNHCSHWHGDTFDLPDGVTLLLYRGYCAPGIAGGHAGLADLHPREPARGCSDDIGHACEIGDRRKVNALKNQSGDERFR